MQKDIKIIPKGWREVKLRDDFKLKQGIYISPDDFIADGYPVYGANGIIGKTDKYNYEDKTVLVSCRGANCGVVHFTQPKSWVNNNSITVTPKDKNIFSNFLYYKLLFDGFEGFITGSAQPQIVVNILQNKIIDFPPLAEQKKIAEILSKVDEDIEKTEEIIKETEKLKKGLLYSFFDKKNVINLKKVRIGDFGNVITGNTPATSNKEYYGGEFLWASPKDIGPSKYLINTEKKLSFLGFSKTRKLPKGSVLVVCIGSTIGKVAITSKEMSTNQQINSINVNNNFDNEYIYYCLLFNKNKIIEKRSTQAVPILNKTSFSNIEVAISKSKNKQKQIAEILSSIDEKIEINKKIKTNLNRLKKGLMNDLLSGKVRV